MHCHGQDKILGTAYSDNDLVVFLEGAGVADPEARSETGAAAHR
ncbi:hypothetical protein ACH4PW_31295 [Streptomyces sp. NPDC017082]